LPEIGTTGYYTATNSDIIILDFVIVKEGTVVIGQGQYTPDVSTNRIITGLTGIENKIGVVNGVVDEIGTTTTSLVTYNRTIKNVYDERKNMTSKTEQTVFPPSR
jgi:hypothetical protein